VRVLILLTLTLTSASVASAWDRFGHLVVSEIAWEHMSERARHTAVNILSRAPRDADLALDALSSKELFLRAGYWPDIVRDEAWPARKEKYDHPTWHYINHFWRDGKPLPEMGTIGELVDRLNRLAGSTPGPIELAWIEYLVGDVHQPLHSSARVTSEEPEGDRGGNDFALEDPEAENLHALWDSILKRANRKRHSESYLGWVFRVASEIANAFPRDALRDELADDRFESWSEAGASIAMTRAYPSYLVRGGVPPRRYEEEIAPLAEKQAALAGYRLAAWMESLVRRTE